MQFHRNFQVICRLLIPAATEWMNCAIPGTANVQATQTYRLDFISSILTTVLNLKTSCWSWKLSFAQCAGDKFARYWVNEPLVTHCSVIFLLLADQWRGWAKNRLPASDVDGRTEAPLTCHRHGSNKPTKLHWRRPASIRWDTCCRLVACCILIRVCDIWSSWLVTKVF